MTKLSKRVSQTLLFFTVAWLSIVYPAEAWSQQAANSTVAAADATSALSAKLALLVGIDEYKYLKDLHGAVNDVENMRKLLVERFGFPDDAQHISVLKNEEANREGILQAIEHHLIAKATSNSIIVFHYSGHGSQMTDQAGGDETDGMDETIVAHDSGRDPYPNKDITDDELNALLVGLTEKTPNVTFIFDSCHSGTAVRGAGLARTVEPDMRPPPKRERIFTSGAREVNEGKNDLRPVNSRYALISGSAAHELSYELEVDGQSYGALTWYLTDQIRRVGADATYRDIMDVVKSRVSATYPVQHPQLEGPGEDQFVFSTKSFVATPSVLAEPSGGNKVTLAAGQVHGASKRSVYDVYPPGTKVFGEDVKSIARVEVNNVDITTSTAEVIQGKVTKTASRAVEREHFYPDPTLRIYFKDIEKSEILQKIKEDISLFKHLTSVETENGYDLLVRETAGYIITEGGEPTEISPRVAILDSNVVSHVVDQLLRWAKWFNILRIGNNQQSKLHVELALKVSKGARDTARDFTDRNVSLTLLEGERFTVEVSNRSQQSVYIALLDLSSDGSVDVVYPTRGEEDPVAPGKTWNLTLETFVPEGHDRVRDILKVIATMKPADFDFLQQAAVRGGPKLAETRGRSRNPLEQLLANAAMGTTRGAKRVEVEDWTTVDRVLEVRRKKQ